MYSNLYHVYVKWVTIGGVQEWGQVSLVLNCNNPENGILEPREDFPSFPKELSLPLLSFQSGGYSPLLPALLPFPVLAHALPGGKVAGGVEEGSREAGGQSLLQLFLPEPSSGSEMAGMADRGIPLPLRHPFIPFSMPCRKSEKVTERIIHHGRLTEYPQPCWGKTLHH